MHLIPVKNQGGKCYSCWAFAAAGALEYHYALKHNKNVLDLSEEELISCDKNSSGCGGGRPLNAFMYVQFYGIGYERDFPYIQNVSRCLKIKRSPIYVMEILHIKRNEKNMAAALKKFGPMTASLAVTDSFKNYKSGIFPESGCNSEKILGLHAVLVLGYGTSGSKKYWMIRNSWGSSWGIDGNFLMARGNNTCRFGCQTSHIPIIY